jgi:hypothetical protein
MLGNYVHRYAEQKLRELTKRLQVVIVNGPRKSGKTTLLRMRRHLRAPVLVPVGPTPPPRGPQGRARLVKNAAPSTSAVETLTVSNAEPVNRDDGTEAK